MGLFTYFRDPQRVLLLKIDICLLLWLFIAGIMKELDQSATTQAYVTGMREDLELYGNELVEFNTYFSIGYALGLVPGQIIQTKLRPSLFLPACEIIWGLLVLFTYRAPNAQTIFVLRFFLGLLSSCFWPSAVSLIANWYKPSELAVRMAIFNVCDVAGSMFLGALQGALYRNMNGVNGLGGWQWLFIIAGSITIAQGIIGAFTVPDTPNITRALWLTKEEKAMAKERMGSFGAETSKLIPVPVLKRKLGQLVTSPSTYFFVLSFALMAWSLRATSYFVLYLESIVDSDGNRRFSVYDVNVIPIGAYALQIVSAISMGALSDWKQWRWQIGITLSAVYGVFLIVLSSWPPNETALLAVYFLTYAVATQFPFLLTWFAEILRREPEARAIIIAISVTIVYVGHATIPLGAFRVSDAPRYPIGFPLTTALAFLAIPTQLGLLFWTRKHPELQERGRIQAVDLLNGNDMMDG
ncbi:major facilitator superfamily transporter [Stachybotrys elegans]|uniref:Major facilitator superfamily transporter n=1 Tax=Stachybotrys elegans TaxID=80388 RepID=A0A8K0SVD3_9HYPO|nr:major facilitator superfamily transporter [Stachybotrys elegans]